MLLTSRFLFGIAGSQIIHRQYIANYVYQSYWMKYYGYLANASYVGMVFGPLCYLLMLVINHRFDIFKHTFILPGYFQAFIGLVYTIAFIKGFKQNY